MAPLPGYLAGIWLTPTTSTSFTNLNLVDDGTHKVFTVPVNDPKRYWDPASALVVQTAPDGSTWTTATVGTYTVQYVNGKITFPSIVTGATPSCRISSGKYFALSFLGDAKSVDVKAAVDVMDATVFTNPPTAWKTKVATLADADITLAKWYLDITLFPYLSNRAVIAVYDGQNANQRLECFAFMKSESIKIAVKDLTSEDLDFTSDGPLYYIPS
ncbi:MAG TPA: hypothetical protein VHV10_02805 [Ktedonobacteraceae bacterium]|jgi:hypothetical protein|nr:hypothetical protein [Ktedonobacteraceae bacterium]